MDSLSEGKMYKGGRNDPPKTKRPNSTPHGQKVKIDEYELIAKQQLEIENLKEKIKDYQEANKKVQQLLYCIGSPLNDNNLKYTNDQLVPFFKISEVLGL